MVIAIKKEILSQLRRIGLHFEPTNLRVVPAEKTLNLIGKNGVGRTFYIDLPNNSHSPFFDSKHFTRIGDSLLKNLRSNSSFIENVQTNLSLNEDKQNTIIFQVNFDFLVKELFNDLKQNLSKLFSQYRRLDEFEIDNKSSSKTTIVEFSSPNIAKPFHVGNLRSTIIGNCVANLLQFNGHNVVRMNYLGDWGTQFGILSLAFDHFGNDQELATAPLKHLFDVYVKGNQEIETNNKWRDLAKERFHQLEKNKDSRIFDQWVRFRELSLNELICLYERIGIKFDIYTSESMYSNSSYDIIDILNDKGLLDKHSDGALFAKVPNFENSNQTISVPLIKNDGSTLYLTRDIAAALHRKKHYNFDRMYYVVDSSQAKHFNNLKNILNSLDDPIYKDIKHLKFGRITGMSTRKGETIFLDDVLNQAKELALQSIKSSPNTKINADDYERVADVLGVSAILIHDLSNRRVKEYRFNWNKALKMNGNTGISLQYTHARLCNLEKNCGIDLNPDCDVNIDAIDTEEGRLLVNLLAMFDEVIDHSYEELEPSLLANYLFELKSAINRANQTMTIKGQPADIAQSRLLLFFCAHNVLGQSMRLLGLNPLDSM